MFANMKVATQLALGFGLMMILMVLVAVLGLARMNDLNDGMRQVGEERWPRSRMALEIVAYSTAIGLGVRDMMLAEKPEEVSLHKEKVLETRRTLAGIIETLNSQVKSPQAKALVAQIIEKRQRFVGGQDRLMSLVESGDHDGAREFLHGQLRPMQTEYQEAAMALATLQGELMAEDVASAKAIYNTTFTIMIVSLVVALLAGSVAALMIIRRLLAQLGGEPHYAAEKVRQLATGDLTVEVQTREGDHSSLLAAIAEMAKSLSTTVRDIKTTSESLLVAAEEVNSTAQSLSSASSEQAAALEQTSAAIEQTSAAIEQMSASIEQNTDNAKVTDGIAEKASNDAQQGGRAVTATVTAMQAIADKISIIDDIAYQTNLLALNAAIEAARAGEHGKGFAVVAAEVRKLAERSQVAAQEIGELASSSVKTAESAGKLLEEMVPSIRKTADLVQEIASASQEQATSASQINQSMSQINQTSNQFNQTTQQNAAASEELAATAEELSSQADNLRALMERFIVSDDEGERKIARPRMVVNNRKPAPKKPPVRRYGPGMSVVSSNAARDFEEDDYVRF